MEKSICFVSRYAHFVLLNQTQKKIGGAEFQQAIIAKALCDRGWQVSFITEKIDTPKSIKIDGIRIFASIDYKSGNPFSRRIFRPVLELWKYMRKVNANIYYQRNPGAYSAVIGLFCRMAGKKFVIAGANDANFNRKNELNVNSYLDILEIKMGIKLAHTIILQNHRQKILLRKYYRRNGFVFYNVYEPPNSVKKIQTAVNNFDKRKLLWIGRIAPQKRPDLCLQLARLLPEYQIIMVGSRTHHHELSHKIKNEVRKINNIVYLGHVSLAEVETLFDSTQGLVNTSYVEGFPNSFLQAWSRGLPVFSFVDPDNLITDNNLGVIASNLEEMAVGIHKLHADKEAFRKAAGDIKFFFENHFLVSQKINDLEKLLLS